MKRSWNDNETDFSLPWAEGDLDGWEELMDVEYSSSPWAGWADMLSFELMGQRWVRSEGACLWSGLCEYDYGL